MKLALRLRDPSPDWVALRKVIEGNSSLREDVTLEVSEQAYRFLDASGREIRREDCVEEPQTAVANVDGKMKLLTMLHERFSASSGSAV